MINSIIQRYGGGHKWVLRDDLSEYGIISYMEKGKSNMLTINQYWELDMPYIMVHISDSDGKIIRKDRYDFIYKDLKHLEFVYTEENGHSFENFQKTGDAVIRENEESQIKKMKERIASLEQTSKQNEKKVQELYKQNEKLQNDLKQAEGRCKVLENNKQKLSERKEELTKLLGEAKQKISELESQRDAIFSRNSDPDLVTMYHQLEDRIANALISLKESKDEAKKWKSMYQELKDQISIQGSRMEDKKPKPIGRPKIDNEKEQKVLKMRKNGITMRRISSELGISIGAIFNIVKRNSK